MHLSFITDSLWSELIPQGIASIMNLGWMGEKAVFTGNFCTIQGHDCALLVVH
jgi:hypothetical protein